MVTPNQIQQERSELVDKIIVHFSRWKALKDKQSPNGKNTNWSVGALFNILDLLDNETVRQAIEVYINLHGLKIKDMDRNVLSNGVCIIEE